ncbi:MULTISPECIES: hypothetical protein [Bacillus]|uniref:hypothetical protein n=1 Tax=Bacillus TaxID=1386 RepID=UPI00273E101C|nr:hypothetical protein [Bacillus sp. MMSF_3328]
MNDWMKYLEAIAIIANIFFSFSDFIDRKANKKKPFQKRSKRKLKKVSGKKSYHR